MVNKAFKDLLGDVMEAYIDDMIIKTKHGEPHTEKLAKAFAVLQENKIYLNPNKCVFGVRLGKFLGYMITHRGIEANP